MDSISPDRLDTGGAIDGCNSSSSICTRDGAFKKMIGIVLKGVKVLD